MENFENDFRELLTILRNRRLDWVFPEVDEQELSLISNYNAKATGMARDLGNAASDALIHQAYGQDFVCFGYT